MPAIVVLVLSSVACSSGSPVLGSAFQSRVVAVCESALAQKKALGPFPFPDFNPTAPDLSKLPDIARSEAKTVEIFQTWMARMQALGQPPTGQAEWADVLRALGSHVRIIVEQQAAAARSDGQTFTKDYYEGNKAQEDMVRASDAAGVPICATAAGA
ncbi:MAG: hypothetical protein ABI879_05670 [Actinomycetota bacterium]